MIKTASESGFFDYLKKQKIKRGFLYFISFSIIGLTILFILTCSSQTIKSIDFFYRFLLIIAPLALVDIGLGACRYFVLMKKIEPEVKYGLCVKANLADIFMSAITPFQTGGGPALLYIFNRGGIPLMAGLSVCMLILVLTLVFLLFASLAVVLFIDLDFSFHVLHYLVNYGFLAFVFFLILFIILLLRPEIFGLTFRFVLKIFPRKRKKQSERLEKLNSKILSKLYTFRKTTAQFFHQPLVLIISFALTILIFLNKFTLAYFLVLGLGIEVNYIDMIAIQTLIYFIPYFSPSPGGSGITELSIAGLMTVFLPKNLLLVYTLLFRFFLLYFPVLLGAYVVLSELKTHSANI